MVANCKYEWGSIFTSVMISIFGYEKATYINIQIIILLITEEKKISVQKMQRKCFCS